MRRIILFVFLLLPGYFMIGTSHAQTLDTLSDDNIYEMKSSAERTLQDYASAMRELINPRISKAYRDRMINEFVTPGNRQIFVDSAYIVYDYEDEHLPPFMMKERPVRTYLNDFNAFYQGTDSQERLSVYYSLRRIHDIETDGTNFYIILDFESQYGDQIPQPRRATLQFVPRGGSWQALINYVKFNVEAEDPQSEGPSVREALVPQWRILAERADTLLQDGQLAEAKVLLDSSLAFNQEPYNARLLGQYYEQQEDLEAAVFSYEQSIALGQEADSAYQDAETTQRLNDLNAELTRREEIARKEEEARKNAASYRFEEVSASYKRGNNALVSWEAPADEPVTLTLFQNGQQKQILRQDYYADEYNWSIPKNTKPGKGYSLQIDATENNIQVTSPTFTIKRKFPIALRVGLVVGAGVAAYLLWPDTVEDGLLPDPPSVGTPEQ
uniref:Tetratricopeptide repeat protein n=1 Tax=Roseihalotalea indica TaxID=2867963 RepID=A0AA49GJC8_9BACT|nr:hypothetical protein K4G66_23160 [Tunicatimonas sp. TK19036]